MTAAGAMLHQPCTMTQSCGTTQSPSVPGASRSRLSLRLRWQTLSLGVGLRTGGDHRFLGTTATEMAPAASTMALTSDLYAHVGPTLLQEAATSMDKALGQR